MTDVSIPMRKLKSSSKKDYSRFDKFIKNIAEELSKNENNQVFKVDGQCVDVLNTICYAILNIYKKIIISQMSFPGLKKTTITDKNMTHATEQIFNIDSRSTIWTDNAISEFHGVIKLPLFEQIKASLRYYAKHMKNKRSGSGDATKKISLNTVCHLHIPIRRVEKWIKRHFGRTAVSVKAAIVLATVLEFCIKDIIYISRNNMPENSKRVTIKYSDLYNGINTEDFYKLLIGQYLF